MGARPSPALNEGASGSGGLVIIAMVIPIALVGLTGAIFVNKHFAMNRQQQYFTTPVSFTRQSVRSNVRRKDHRDDRVHGMLGFPPSHADIFRPHFDWGNLPRKGLFPFQTSFCRIALMRILRCVPIFAVVHTLGVASHIACPLPWSSAQGGSAPDEVGHVLACRAQATRRKCNTQAITWRQILPGLAGSFLVTTTCSGSEQTPCHVPLHFAETLPVARGLADTRPDRPSAGLCCSAAPRD